VGYISFAIFDYYCQ